MVVDVSIPPAHQIGAVEWPRRREADPAREFATLSIDPVVDDASAEAWMNAQLKEGRLPTDVRPPSEFPDDASWSAYLRAQLSAR